MKNKEIRLPVGYAKAKRIIEAALFTSNKPLLIENLNRALEIDNKIVKGIINELKDEYRREGRSFQIVEIAQGFQICTLPTYAFWLKKVVKKEREGKLSFAALETLSIIAYRQPVTRAEIEIIRGVETGSILKSFIEKGLIRIAGRKKTLGKPLIYRTTALFLQYFGLRSLNDLPKLKQNETNETKNTAPADR
ncbi:MAG: SMC-Scp complex subunit ScpB [Candidatus Omnitrophica bacterium]|nr:SMC-Scp complex subunit ScpB [Candidatus Omnitrophota bacterium]